MGFCRKATELISTSLDRPLSRRERFALRMHLVICGHCRRYQRQVRKIEEAVRTRLGLRPAARADTAPRLSEEARRRVLRVLQEQAD